MSYTTELMEYLSLTRDMTVAQLNNEISRFDSNAKYIESHAFAHTVLGYMQSDSMQGKDVSFDMSFNRAASLKAKQPWLFIDPTPPAPMTDPVIKAVKPAIKSVAAPSKTKLEIAVEIFAQLEDKSKASVMAVFEQQLNTTRAGAQTYYYAVGGQKLGRGRLTSGTTGV